MAAIPAEMFSRDSRIVDEAITASRAPACTLLPSPRFDALSSGREYLAMSAAKAVSVSETPAPRRRKQAACHGAVNTRPVPAART